METEKNAGVNPPNPGGPRPDPPGGSGCQAVVFRPGRRYLARDRVTDMLIEADDPDGPWYPVK